jgi:acetyl esterase
MTLDPQVQGLLQQLAEQGAPDFSEMTVAEARAFMAAFLDLQGPPQPVFEVRELKVTGPDRNQIRMRLYRPQESGVRPVIVYFHGGGWVLGDLDVADKPCRQLANITDCVVVSVDYRLAPEHKAPAAAEDCYAATAWVAEHAGELGGDGARLAVAGDSAGGNLAVAVALMARDRGTPRLALHVPIYPITDVRRSRLENGEGMLLTRRAMEWFEDHYLATPDDAANPYIAPLRAPELAGLPPAVVVTAGYCPLRAEGEAYVTRLRAAAVPAVHLPNPTMIHGFLWMGGVVNHTADAYERLGAAVRERLSPSTISSQ